MDISNEYHHGEGEVKSDYLAIQDSNKNLSEDLLLLLDGYTLYYKGAYSGAYIYGWMIIETVIDHIWKEYVTDLKISSDDKRGLDRVRNIMIS